MKNISPDIEKLCFDKWFRNTVNPGNLEGLEIARVIAVHRDSYTINNGENDVIAELIGKIIHNAASPMDYPAVGDLGGSQFL